MIGQASDIVLPANLHLTADELAAVRDGFRLGTVLDVRFLPTGLMNRNWRVETGAGAYALKRITDVSVDAARRNLRVVAQLSTRNHPVCEPVLTATGDPVLTAGGAAYCVVPWVAGDQPRGIELGIEQARAAGTALGRLHAGLNDLGGAELPANFARPIARVADPVSAAADADRFLSHICHGRLGSPFDRTAAEFLEQRKVLLDKYQHLMPLSDQPAGPFGWTHGDFQHLNLIWRAGELAAVIDWDRIKVRPFGEEVVRSATLLFGHDGGRLDLVRVSAFVRGYRATVRIADRDLVDAVDRLWWKRMCDYWHLEFHYDRSDHSCDHLFLSASLFLGWWTDRLDEVRNAFTPCG